ncbi:Integrase core domain protein [Limihaloglobus sulfuriphilus]|uniref:Integrase core domain protein n=1 Tax=Limihaloglobus sulfuriphilus TaxID=1851148 RepID=A0A1Q2MCW1_9BACT|nr:helix-turn-helix domain-containing protein [Limihaloglobus sulfuriphilus]AQQ70531.1 Integrase core domain protein [Limihaloglobus sulfuriphilus]
MKQKIWITVAACIAYCINKELYRAIDYLKAQVEVLLEKQKKQNKRIMLNDRQRIKIAAKAKQLTRKMFEECTVLFTPDTVLRWYRKLIAEKYDGFKNPKKAGRPPITPEIEALVVKFKKENLRWGYQKIADQINYLGFEISETSVKNILIRNGLDPEPDLTVKSTWHEFLKSHWDVIAACDFFTVELLLRGRLVRCMVFFVIDLSTRKVFYTPIKLQPDGKYMRQAACILTDFEDGFLNGKRYLIHDRDPLFKSHGFHQILKSSGVEPIKLPPRSPDLNSVAERYVKTVKFECLNQLILTSVEQLEYVLKEFGQYYHHERIHQSLGGFIEPKHKIDDNAEIQCIERLGGLLKSYHRLAA